MLTKIINSFMLLSIIFSMHYVTLAYANDYSAEITMYSADNSAENNITAQFAFKNIIDGNPKKYLCVLAIYNAENKLYDYSVKEETVTSTPITITKPVPNGYKPKAFAWDIASCEPISLPGFLLAQPYELLTNGVDNPAAVDNQAPVFSWKIKSDKRNTLQTAYRIVVSTNEKFDTIVWDSGKVTSDYSSNVEYKGANLTADTLYFWKVIVWDNYGLVSSFSPRATFRVGLSKTDWTANYIWDNNYTLSSGVAVFKTNDFAYFRKSFNINKEIAQAVVYTTAHNDYQLYLNGEMLGVGPARSDPEFYGQYCAYDITDKLQNGKNTFASLAHWHGVWVDSGVNAKPAYILEARLTYKDGTKEIIKTDSTWKVNGTTPYIEENPVYFGFDAGIRNRASIKYDTRREISGWNTVNFDDSSWTAPANLSASVDTLPPAFNLYAQLIAEQKEMEYLEPISVTKSGSSWLVDFGKTISGWPQITMKSNAPNSEVKVQFWEVQKAYGDAGYDSYICKGNGTETFKAPYIRHTSFKVLEITGYIGELTKDDVRGIVAHTYMEKTGNFTSSDTRLNAVYQMSERSGRQNLQQGMISVDANREQSSWTADSWNVGIGYLYNDKNTMAIDKTIKDYAFKQNASGYFPTCSPAYKSYVIPEWSMYWPMMLWEQYLATGNEKLLRDYYPNFKKFISYLNTTIKPIGGLANPSGWRISDYAGGIMDSGGANIATNSQMYMNYIIAAKVAKVLNQTTDETTYSSKATKLKDNINIFLLSEGKNYITMLGGNQRIPLASAWAIRSNAVSNVLANRVTEWFASQRDNYVVGGYGGDALYSGLYEANLGEIATADFARYDNMIAMNNTNWESFGSLGTANMGNHAWTSYPSYILQRYVGGIRPTSGGYKTFDIKPVVGGVNWAEAIVPTIKGNIKTHWEKTDNSKLTLSAIVPVNTSAVIYVPTNYMSNVTIKENNTTIFENGNYTLALNDIKSGKIEKDFVSFVVGSGNYNFEAIGTAGTHTEIPASIIIDDENTNGKFITTNTWTYSKSTDNPNERYGNRFTYIEGVTGTPTASATYSADILSTGNYSVYAWWAAVYNRASNTPFTVSVDGVEQPTVRFDQRINGRQWNLIGSYSANKGSKVTVKISNDIIKTGIDDKYVIADAIKIEPAVAPLTLLQQLQMRIYEIRRVNIDTCTNKEYVNELNTKLTNAQLLCDTGSATDVDVQTAINGINLTYEKLAEYLVDLALNKPVTASESYELNGWGAKNLTDGSTSTGYTSDVQVAADISLKPISLTIDLGQNMQFSGLVLHPSYSSQTSTGTSPNFPTDFTIQVSEDGTNYTTVKTITNLANPNLQPSTLLLNTSFTKRYVRIVVTKLGKFASSGETVANPYRLQFSEIEVRK